MAIALASLTVFSQVGTKNTTTNKDSVVVLPKLVAKAVAKDVIRKDSVEAENKILKRNDSLLRANISLKDSVINAKDNVINLHILKENNYETMLTLKDVQKQNLEGLVVVLKNDLKKTKIQLKATRIGGIVITGTLLYFILR